MAANFQICVQLGPFVFILDMLTRAGLEASLQFTGGFLAIH
jgi:hypothetical protein